MKYSSLPKRTETREAQITLRVYVFFAFFDETWEILTDYFYTQMSPVVIWIKQSIIGKEQQ